MGRATAALAPARAHDWPWSISLTWVPTAPPVALRQHRVVAGQSRAPRTLTLIGAPSTFGVLPKIAWQCPCVTSAVS